MLAVVPAAGCCCWLAPAAAEGRCCWLAPAADAAAAAGRCCYFVPYLSSLYKIYVLRNKLKGQQFF